MPNYTKQRNYIKTTTFSQTITNVKLSDKQRHLIQEQLLEISILNNRITQTLEFDRILFLLPLLLLEGESSALIEGTRSVIEDFAYDIEEINNIPQWTTRNLITIYKQYVLNDYYLKHFKLSTGALCQIHLKLYENNPDSKFRIVYDPSHEIKRVQPGRVLSNDKNPNYIGVHKDINLATLITLQPSRKKAHLDDLFVTIESKIANDELLVDHIIMSHPVFEAIHPFNDGNGRLGRMLLSLLFRRLLKRMSLPVYLSEAFAQDKEKYKQTLLGVQLNNDQSSWSNYIDYFIECLAFTNRQLTNRVTKIIALFKKFTNSKATSTPLRQELTKRFFKHMVLNKNLTIRKMQKLFPILSIQTIYNDWNIVIYHLAVLNKQDGYYVFTSLLAILREKM